MGVFERKCGHCGCVVRTGNNAYYYVTVEHRREGGWGTSESAHYVLCDAHGEQEMRKRQQGEAANA